MPQSSHEERIKDYHPKTRPRLEFVNYVSFYGSIVIVSACNHIVLYHGTDTPIIFLFYFQFVIHVFSNIHMEKIQMYL